ncbi:MAG: DUF4293 domain-containing protein [Cyclobacteriaceae bacterium]
MWQRIQTVFLGITIVALIISLVMPVWQGQAEGIVITLTPFYLLEKGQYTYYPYALTAVLVVAAATISIIEIRRFDNRMLQMKLGLLNTLLLLGSMISIVVFTVQLSKVYPAAAKNGLGMFLIFGAVLCNWLALRFIRRDERLVRDSERLR